MGPDSRAETSPARTGSPAGAAKAWSSLPVVHVPDRRSRQDFEVFVLLMPALGALQTVHERLVPELPQRSGVLEHRVRPVDGGRGGSGCSLRTAATYPPRTAESMSVAPTRWYGTIRNFLPRSHSSCSAMTSCSPGLARAAGLVVEDGVQHGQEVTLTGAERPVQIRGMRVPLRTAARTSPAPCRTPAGAGR